MPQRLTKIFDERLTPVDERYAHISECSYQGTDLDSAERFEICEGSSYIEAHELLARVMERPSHVKADVMEFTGGAFLEARKRGLSVQQSSLTRPEEIHLFGSEKAKEKNREYLGFVEGLCSLFRNAFSPTDGRRLFGVFSTPLAENPSHADIFVIVVPNKGEKAAIQQVFYDAFNLASLQEPGAH